jgi:transposase
MTLHARDHFPIPEDTARVARQVYPKGDNVWMTARDHLGFWYRDSDYADLFVANQGRAAESPARLNMILIVQFAEGLTDRQVAEAVRSRIDLKYLLGLRLTDQGFDPSILTDYRAHLIAGGKEAQLLKDMLVRLQEKDLLKARGKQRTDSTHVLAAIRVVNRLERIGETMRAALNVLATVVPDWLRAHVEPDWFDRYGPRFEQYRLPKRKSEREQLAIDMGTDGYRLLSAVYDDTAPQYLRQIHAVETMRRVWIQQFYLENDKVYWRTDKDSPPPGERIQSPYDDEARYRTKRDLNWTGYTAHFTETCDEDRPNLITDVQTTDASVVDSEVTGVIHESLANKGLLPSEHLVDAGYMEAELIVTARNEYGVDLVGRIGSDTHWQSRQGIGFDQSSFDIDWEAKQVQCPAGQVSYRWQERKDSTGKDLIYVYFAPQQCHICAQRGKCTRAEVGGRSLVLRPQALYIALQEARQRQETEEFRERYNCRAGVEGTISQGTRSFELRRTRYRGLAKTYLQDLLTAGAMNVTRAVSWLHENPKAKTRRSRFQRLAIAA